MDINSILKVIDNPIRLNILHWLKSPKQHFPVASQLVDADIEGVCVSIIQEKVGLSQSTVSLYLTALQREQLVISTRIGPWTYYKRNEEKIAEFQKKLSEIL
jgi:ArsR family transcriptional regulator